MKSQSGAIWRGTDKPAGCEFFAPKPLADLTDCPRCKFGTLDLVRENDSQFQRCADCGAEFGKPPGNHRKSTRR